MLCAIKCECCCLACIGETDTRCVELRPVDQLINVQDNHIADEDDFSKLCFGCSLLARCMLIDISSTGGYILHQVKLIVL